MNEKEIKEFLAKYGTPAIRREKTITSRRYNLIAFRNTESGKQIVDTIEYLTMKQARELKSLYLKEDGIRCDIVEDVTTDRNGNEIVFHEKPEIPLVVGENRFGVRYVPGIATATKLITERDRRNARNKASFARKANPSRKQGKTIRYTGSFRDPKSPLYPMYVDNVNRRGFTVKDKITGETVKGLQHEIVEHILYLLNTLGRNKNDLDIRFNGV